MPPVVRVCANAGFSSNRNQTEALSLFGAGKWRESMRIELMLDHDGFLYQLCTKNKKNQSRKGSDSFNF